MSAIVDHLIWAIKNGEPIPPFQENLDIADAYEIQKKVSERVYSSQLVGLKAGVTSEEMQNALKIATEVLGTDKHHIPKEVVCIEAFVHTKSGKLDRVATLRKVMSEL